MGKNRFVIMLGLLILPGIGVVQAGSLKPAEPETTKSDQVASVRTAFTDAGQGYQLISDVLDCFAGPSESANYRIPVNSGGQASPIGISEGTVYDMDAGFVYASKVNRGDPNADGIINLGDAIYTLNYLFKGGPNPCPMEAGDANCTGVVDLGDAIYILNYLFKGGPAPVC